MFYLIYIILFLLLGIYFIANVNTQNSTTSILEGYINSSDNKKRGFTCPDILLQKGIRYYLYNSKMATVPGVNPIEFQNLEDYTEFMEWQRSQGIRCPVLYLQYSYNAQGEPIYKGRPGPTNLQGGLPPAPPINNLNNNSTNNSMNNGNSPNTDIADNIVNPSPSYLTEDNISMPVASNLTYCAIDANNSHNETTENLLHNGMSANAMDDNWGGIQYTQQLVDSGVYDDNNVSIAIA